MSINLGSKRFVIIAVVAAIVGFLIVVALMRGPRGPRAGTRDDDAASNNAVTTNDAAASNQPREQQQQRAGARDSDDDDDSGLPFDNSAAARGPGNASARQGRAAPSPDTLVSHLIGGTDPTATHDGEPRDWVTTLAAVTIRLALAALLAALLAFRPRRTSLHFKRNPFVAQTQILLAVIASALMMIVGDSTARAFGIFGAASLVRFRTNIKDPKEISVLLLSLAIGLSTGVGRVELGLVLALFTLLLLWGLEYREPELVTRSLELTVKTRNIGTTQDALLSLFRRYEFDSELREIDRPDEKDAMGTVVYYMSASPSVSLDRLSQEILAADPKNVDSVAWDQQKNNSYFYQ